MCCRPCRTCGLYITHFLWQVYEEKVPKDHGVGQIVMRISATDIDDGKNGTIVYSLRPDPSSPRDIDFFEVVRESGEVKLKKPIDDVSFSVPPFPFVLQFFPRECILFLKVINQG